VFGAIRAHFEFFPSLFSRLLRSPACVPPSVPRFFFYLFFFFFCMWVLFPIPVRLGILGLEAVGCFSLVRGRRTFGDSPNISSASLLYRAFRPIARCLLFSCIPACIFARLDIAVDDIPTRCQGQLFSGLTSRPTFHPLSIQTLWASRLSFFLDVFKGRQARSQFFPGLPYS